MLDLIKFGPFSSLICFNCSASDCSNPFSSFEAIFYFKESFSVDNSSISSPIISRVFLIADIVETNCPHFVACVDNDCELKHIKSCTALLLTILLLKSLCIANSN